MIRLFTTGGTIDKIYFDAKSEFFIGDSLLPEILSDSNIREGFAITEVLRKDSLDITDEDRQRIVEAVESCEESRIIITHGTDTMPQTARALERICGNRTIVLFGAMQPARMRRTDAPFNLGFAWAAVQLKEPGVYVAMNGQVFPASQVRKNLEAGRFESL